MSVDAETYIVISLMFAVFAAVAAVGSSMVLGAGFERLRAGFDIVRRQSGFFADAIHKLDQRTQRLDEETAKMKSGLSDMGDRVTRVEKQVLFVGDAINSIEQRILQGTPDQSAPAKTIRMKPVVADTRFVKKELDVQTGWVATPVREQTNQISAMQDDSIIRGLFQDFPEHTQIAQGLDSNGQDTKSYEGEHDDIDVKTESSKEKSSGISTLISQYWMGEQSGSGKSVMYH